MQLHVLFCWWRLHVIFCKGKTHGRNLLFGESISRTQRQWQHSCTASRAVLCWSGVFADSHLVERNSRELLLLSQLAPSDSCQFGERLAVSAGSSNCCWFVFGILTVLNWYAGILTEIEITPKYNSKQACTPLSCLPSFLPYLWAVGYRGVTVFKNSYL